MNFYCDYVVFKSIMREKMLNILTGNIITTISIENFSF